MKIRKTNSHYLINILLNKASTLLKVINKSITKHRRSKTRMLSLNLKSITLILNKVSLNQELLRQEMVLSISTILQITLLWINKSRKKKNLEKRHLKVNVILHQQSSAIVIWEVNAMDRFLKIQVNTTHSLSQILSWEEEDL
jgi:hypothetical protein